jgi:hypothetical protein
MLTITADDVGRHDFLYTACSIEMYHIQYGVTGGITRAAWTGVRHELASERHERGGVDHGQHQNCLHRTGCHGCDPHCTARRVEWVSSTSLASGATRHRGHGTIKTGRPADARGRRGMIGWWP